MLSTLRSIAARTLPDGASLRLAADVQRSLESASDPASPRDLERIVEHAARTVPFYRRRGPLEHEDLPVVSKPMMVRSLADFLADGADVDRLPSRLSSGTSGIVFRSTFDRRRISRHRAELVGAYRYLGADPFGTYLHCREWFQVTRRDRAAHALRGQRLYAAAVDEPTIRRTAAWLRRRRGTVLIGLCSYLETLLARFDDLGITVPVGTVSVVLGVGEPATEALRTASRRQLGVDLSMRYSNTENGLLGFTRAGSTTYSLNTSAFHIEILDQDADRPAAPGALGRIVVTDLHNRAMPFLRYDTGDLGRFALDGAGRVLPGTLGELAGRVRDFPLAGTAASPRRATHFTILEPVEQIREITQFQLRQHALGEFSWILTAPRSNGLEARLRRILDEEIGDIVRCDVVYTDGELHSGAGKRQTFVNEMPDVEQLLATADRS
ncbi:hypothetical protein [Brachybacterium sp. YJGR34]|uniref:hypothetical protein n=1 Tax=Brachybacterium sp. YJGR34 TaxID=2059911 RepID=UPI000E0A6B37|nr:hypothetical protein [Brachybacterium sp. YJGR34]